MEEISQRAPIPATQMERLVAYLGYGRLSAPLYFLGLEEGLGQRDHDPSWSPERELTTRATWQPVMDAREASEQIHERYWERRDYSQVWRVAAKLARGLLQGADDWNDNEAAHDYVVDHLGRADGKTFLGELMPLPAKATTAWPEFYRAHFSDRDAYQTAIWPKRKAQWKMLLANEKPRFLVCYGGRTLNAPWRQVRELFDLPAWESLAGGRVLKGTAGKTRVYLTPFFGNGRYRTADLSEIISDARGVVG